MLEAPPPARDLWLALAVGVLSLGVLVGLLLLPERPNVAPPPSAPLAQGPGAWEELLAQVERVLAEAERPFPRLPTKLRARIRLTAQAKPVRYRKYLLEILDTQGIPENRRRAVCYCLLAGLRKKEAILALLDLQARSPELEREAHEVLAALQMVPFSLTD